MHELKITRKEAYYIKLYYNLLWCLVARLQDCALIDIYLVCNQSLPLAMRSRVSANLFTLKNSSGIT